MKMRNGSHAISGAFVFLLLGLFAVMSTMLILFSVQAYRGTIERTAANAADRVMANYIRNIIRASDAEGLVSVQEIDGTPVIEISEMGSDEDYRTWIYAWDGSLCELFSDAEEDFCPERGDAICPAESMRAKLDNGLLTVTLTAADGNETIVSTAVRTGGGAR